MVNLSTSLSGLSLQNPIIPASGCFGYGQESRAFYDIDVLGAFAMKGTTLQPRFGNELPRVADCDTGMLNSIGLQNPGIDHVMQHELPAIAPYFHQPIFANISGFSVQDYVICCETISRSSQIGLIELNISCPNVHGGGMSFGSDSQSAAEVTRACKAATSLPIYVKLSPNVTDIAAIALACADAGADGLCLINTLQGMRLDLKTRKPILARGSGGYSGPGIFPVALRMVYDVFHALDGALPIIGVGGIRDCATVVEMLLAGASAVEIGSEHLVNPMICHEIIQELPDFLGNLGVYDLKSLIGAAHA